MAETAKPATDAVPVYLCRSNIFTGERRYQLDADVLTWSDARSSGRIAYANIKEMRIACTPAFGQEFWRCVLRTNDRQTLVIPSMHYRALGRFDDRYDGFASFVSELLLRAARQNAHAKFFYREGWSIWIANLILALVSALLLVFAVTIVLYEWIGPPGYIALFALIALLPSFWRTVSAGPPKEIGAEAVARGELPF